MLLVANPGVRLSEGELEFFAPRPAVAAIQPTPLSSAWVAHGSVRAIAPGPGGTLFLGGLFDALGPYTGHSGKIDRTSGQADITWPRVNGSVDAIAPDGAGGFYIGGSFNTVGSVARRGLAHILSGGIVDPAWNPDPNGSVRVLLVSGGFVYAAGGFTTVGGSSRRYLAQIDASGRATSWNPSPSGTVEALLVSDSMVYAGGRFTTIGGRARRGLAQLDDAGAATAWDPNPDGVVYALAGSGNGLYVGGRFTTIGGQGRSNIAQLDASGAATAWNPGADNEVRVLAVGGGIVYASGEFRTIGGQSRNGIAQLDASGAATAWDPHFFSADVYAMAVAGSSLYIGGWIRELGGGDWELAEIDATGSLTAWKVQADDAVFALAVWGDSVYAGGWFTSVGGVPRRNIAQVDSQGIPTPWKPDADYVVSALAVDGDLVYAAGAFWNIGGQARRGIAQLDAGGAATAWDARADHEVQSVAVSGETVYAGGYFTSIGGQVRERIAQLDANAAATAWNPGANDVVFHLAVAGEHVYAGGWFITIGGQTRQRIAQLDAEGRATAWNANLEWYDFVDAIAIDGDRTLVGGQFASIGGQPRSNVAALDAAGLATEWNPGADSGVRALLASGAVVYAGGDFRTIGSRQRNQLAQLGASGIATSWNPGAGNAITAFAHSGGCLWVAGNQQISAEERLGLACFPDVNVAPSFTKGGSQSAADDAGAQTAAGWATNISAGPPEEAGQSLEFVVTNDNNALFALQPAVAPDGTLTYTPAGGASGTATVTVRLRDGGGTAFGGADTSAPQTFTITVMLLNDAPSFTAGPNQTTPEDGGAQEVTGWATEISAGPGETAQVVDFIVTNDNSALFSAQPAVDAGGTLTYAPAQDANGSATVTVRIHDNGGTTNGGADTSAPQTFTIAITPVNDPPSFTNGPDQFARRKAGPVSVSGWASAIIPGPSNETAQALSFVVTNDNNGLFATQPALTPDGTLVFQPGADVVGTATVTVRLRDDGGTADGGQDASAPRTFTITVVDNRPPVIDPVGGQTVAEGAFLGFTVTARDPDGDHLTYEAAGLPAGALLDAETGAFSWIPGFNAAGSHEVTFTVSDGDLTDAEPVTIVVGNTNRAPWIDPIGGRSVAEGAHLAFVVASTDPDGDGVALSVDDLPAGATFDPTTGAFAWRPGYDQAGEYAVTFRAVDTGSPVLAREEAVAVTVTAPGGPIFSDDFADGASPADWTAISGSWTSSRGTYSSGSLRGNNLSRVSSIGPELLPIGAGVLQAKVNLTSLAASAGPNALLVFSFQDAAHYRWVKVTRTAILIGQTGTFGGVPAGVKKKVAKTQRLGAFSLFKVKIYPDGWVSVYKGAERRPALSYRFTAGGGASVVPGGVGLGSSRAKSVFDEVGVWEDSGL